MNNKGISLIALVIMIIVIIIIASIAINNSTGSYDNGLDAKAKEERAQVVDAINYRFGDNQIDSSINPLVGDTLPQELFEKETDEERKEAIKEYIINLFVSEGKLRTDNNKEVEEQIKKFVDDNFIEMEYTRILRHNEVVQLGLNSVSNDSEFLVNYYSIDVVGPIQ